MPNRVIDPERQIELFVSEVQIVQEAVRRGVPLGPSTGFGGLDLVLGGYVAPGLYIVHGQPGVGKTALAAQISASGGVPALYLTTEMTVLEMVRRHLARVFGIKRNDLLSGDPNIDSSLLARLSPQNLFSASTGPSLPRWYLVDGCDRVVSTADLEDGLQAIRQDQHSGSCVLVIDSLQSWALISVDQSEGEYAGLNSALQALRALAVRLKIPVWVISERNRQAMKTGGISAGAGTRRIEYSADVMLDLSIAKDANGVPAGMQPINVFIAKNRFGPAGFSIVLAFDGDRMAFHEVDIR